MKIKKSSDLVFRFKYIVFIYFVLMKNHKLNNYLYYFIISSSSLYLSEILNITTMKKKKKNIIKNQNRETALVIPTLQHYS